MGGIYYYSTENVLVYLKQILDYIKSKLPEKEFTIDLNDIDSFVKDKRLSKFYAGNTEISEKYIAIAYAYIKYGIPLSVGVNLFNLKKFNKAVELLHLFGEKYNSEKLINFLRHNESNAFLEVFDKNLQYLKLQHPHELITLYILLKKELSNQTYRSVCFGITETTFRNYKRNLNIIK